MNDDKEITALIIGQLTVLGIVVLFAIGLYFGAHL